MPTQDNPIASLIAHWRAKQAKTVVVTGTGSTTLRGSGSVQVIRPTAFHQRRDSVHHRSPIILISSYRSGAGVDLAH
jgi:hypothetical protein